MTHFTSMPASHEFLLQPPSQNPQIPFTSNETQSVPSTLYSLMPRALSVLFFLVFTKSANRPVVSLVLQSSQLFWTFSTAPCRPLPCLAVDPINYRLPVAPYFQLDPPCPLLKHQEPNGPIPSFFLLGMPVGVLHHWFVGCLVISSKAKNHLASLGRCNINFCTQSCSSAAHLDKRVFQTTPPF